MRTRVKKMPQYFKSALRIGEVELWFEDRNWTWENGIWPLDKMIHEMQYILSCYRENGHDYNDSLEGRNTPPEQVRAQKNVKQITAWLKKNGTTPNPYPEGYWVPQSEEHHVEN